jgi:4'-phosphopantetheinyl transferase
VAGVLEPRLWRLGERPPSPPRPGDLPLLLLLDRRARPPSRPPGDLLATLSAPERQRHAAYRREADQDRFLLGRSALRQVLGQWLGQAPGAVRLRTGAHGKPHCPDAPAFNLSHSGALILLAFHAHGAVGVDVERHRPDRDWRAIAREVFPPARVAALEALAAEERAAAFLQAWCRLEARLKARGEGLAGLGRLRRQDGVSGWETLWDVRVPPGYGAALALAIPIKDPPAEAAGAGHPSPPA